MKEKISVSLFVLLTLSTTIAKAELQPYSMLEELRTGAISVSENTLATAQGQKTQLKLMKRRKNEYSTHDYYEIINDGIHLCEDGTPANYISVQISSGGTTVISAYQKRTNTELRNEYIVHCTQLVYE